MSALMNICHCINSVILYKILTIPLLIWLFVGVGFLIMFKIKFANITYLPEALKYAFGKKKQSDSVSAGVGSITALMSQLACNLGIGNFAGSALALYYGGPGVIFWFFVLSFISSAIKFGEVVLAHKYRIIENGEIKGGAFYFIEKGLGKKFKFKRLIKFFAILSALSVVFICTTTSAMQFNQINTLLFAKNGVLAIDKNVYVSAILMAIFIGLLLFGGLKKIGFAADILVPIMGVLYIAICLVIIAINYNNILPSFGLVFAGAFNFEAGLSASVATFLFALQKIINATDTGAGFSAISQSNSNVKIAGQQGLVSFFDPFIVATIMAIGAFAVLVIGVPYNDPQFMGLLAIKQAFISLHPIFEHILILIAFMFGFTTIMAVGFYVQQACIYLFGSKFKNTYIVLYIFGYSIFSFGNATVIFSILDIAYSSGVMINLIAIALLHKDIKMAWQEYLLSKK